ncbi:long-chain-fatty-acid--CoA ligase [Desmospora profundinema]|uniref:Long-chain acyl-CoA synthetase n=1 Tax=Desmospora profundinema TaxID=1571184 RepID=A0ABU1IIE3_9BACL|nr:long-chain-fatty-acid--CoA ligase [Desmospora profundinema]MDR6224163.1 long-chain acyl-CoA synthetase [Desmospora profundinema]
MIITKGLMVSAQNAPEKIAVIDGEDCLTYSEWSKRVSQLKGALLDRGIQKGDRVALVMHNSFRFLESIYAVTSIGAVVVPLNVRLAVPEMEAILEDAGPKLLFLHREFAPLAPVFQDKLPSLERVVLAEDREVEAEGKEACALYEDWIQSQAPSSLDADGVEEEDVAGFFYTGGTTGTPKGVMLTHRNLVANAYHVALTAGYHPGTHYLHAAPMFHLADGASAFAVTLVGGTHSHLRVFRPEAFVKAVERDRPNATLLVPTMIQALVNHPSASKQAFSGLNQLLYGGSSMPVEVLRQALHRWPHIRFFQAYGMSEAAPVLTMLRPEDHNVLGTEREERIQSCGQAVPGVEMKLVDRDGLEVPVGEVGEVVARGPNIMKGYWNRPQETDRALKDGWYRSGDLARRDRDGYYYIVDRMKDMIVSGGENVYSTEVENVLYSHPAVREAAVIGIPDEQWGERVHAVVVKRKESDLDADELIAFCRKSLAGFKLPKTIDFVPELPKSGAGKILKRTLRERYGLEQTR